jgi:carbamoyl-phosphate synthase large subunit
VTSLSSLAKTVREPGVVELCQLAVRTVAPGASGAFSIDVKEDAAGRPHVTEINAGRFFMAMTAFDSVLKHNMALTYVRLALGQDVGLHEAYDVVEDYYLVRDLDTRPGIFHADDLFEGIKEWHVSRSHLATGKERSRGRRTAEGR